MTAEAGLRLKFLRDRASASTTLGHVAGSGAALGPGANDVELITLQRAIASRIEPGQPHIVQFMSCDARDAASGSARDYASFAAANAAKRTLLVDASFAPAGADQAYSLASSWLDGADCHDAILPDLLAPGLFHARLADRGQVLQLGSATLCQSFADLMRQFAAIIIDAVAPAVAPEVLALMPAIGGVVLVVRSGSTHEHEIQQARRRVEVAGGRLLGAVFTAPSKRLPSWLSRWDH